MKHNTKNIYIEKIKAIANYEQYVLEDLRKMSGYPSDIACFRILCYRYDLKFAKGYRGETSGKVAQLQAEGFDFEQLTLKEIKEKLGYEKGLDGLVGLLKRHNIKFKNEENNESTLFIHNAIKQIGNTEKLTPKEIMAKIGVEIRNPAQYLIRLGVQYKKKLRKA